MNRFDIWLIKARRSKGWTQTMLSKESGLSPSYICNLESAKYNPSAKSQRMIANAFGFEFIWEMMKEAGV